MIVWRKVASYKVTCDLKLNVVTQTLRVLNAQPLSIQHPQLVAATTCNWTPKVEKNSMQPLGSH